MKQAKNILSQITPPADAAIAEREDETTETTPLHPKQLQQFLQQLNWQEQDLTAGGISATLLTEEFNRPWHGRLNRWFLREPLLFKILQWPFSKIWLKGAVFPTDNEQLLKDIYGVNGYLEGASLVLNKVWSNLVLSFMLVDIYNYFVFPNYPYRSNLLDIFLARASNEKTLSTVLIQPAAWPILLATPILWGVLKAALSAQHAKPLDKDKYRTLLETLAHYQATLWKDIGRWVLPSLVPEFVPTLTLFALLPKPKLKLALESAERLLLWDRRISPDEQRILLQQVQVLARKATHITQLQALAALANMADGIALNDLVRLSQQGVNAETLKSLLWVKQQAKQTLQQITRDPSTQSLLSSVEMEPLINSPLMDDKLTIPSRSRYLYAQYLLWTLGQAHDYRLQPLFWSYLVFQGYFKARFFYLLGRGMYDTLSYYWDKWRCESEGKLWSYFSERAEWDCSFCGDLPLFYNDVFDEKTCWEAYLRNPRKAVDVIKLIGRLHWQNIDTLDFSKQINWSEQDWINVFGNLVGHARRIRTLLIGGTSYSEIIDIPSFPPLAVQAIANYLKEVSAEKLSLGQRNINDQGVIILAQTQPSPFLHVQHLFLQQNNIGHQGIKALTNSSLPALTLLHLCCNHIGDEGAEALASTLTNSSLLLHLDLSNNNIGYKGIKALTPVLTNSPSLLRLNLGGNNIGTAGVENLVPALFNSPLQDLDLQLNNIGDGGVKALMSVLNNTSLQTLNLGINFISTEGIKVLAQVFSVSPLQRLYLFGNNIGIEEIKILALTLATSSLQFLDLSDNNIGDEGVKILAPKLIKFSLLYLDMENNHISDSGIKALAPVLANASLQTLGLSNNRISDEGIKILAPALTSSPLRVLSLSGNYIGDNGVKELAGVLANSSLQALYLRVTNIGNEGVKFLAPALVNSPLLYLTLAGNNIGDEAVKAIALVLPNASLQTLHLFQNRFIGDEAAITLANMLTNNPTRFDLNTFLTPDAKKALARAKANTPLTALSLSRNNITAKGAIALCRVLPQTYIPVSQLDLANNPIDLQQVDPQTCFISSSAVSLESTGPYVTLYHLCQATLRYAMDGYQYITAHWLTTRVFLSPTHKEQSSSSLDSISNTIEEVPSDSSNFSPEEITINESPIINGAPSKINENESLFTFKITSTTLIEPTNCTSKNLFSFFNTLTKTSPPVTTQPLNSNFLALPKPAETLSMVNALGAIGATVTGMLAVGYWVWKNFKRSNNAVPVSEKTTHSQPEIKTSKLLS
jgi:Ran GTPase-activating protein (RanGAP) involved in mRNA processing and transport